MDQVHVVRHKVLVEGRTQRAVARELGISRVTVRKYLDQAAPARQETQPRGRPVWEAVGPRIETLLAESPQWTGGKQRLTATRLHQLLRAEGHRVGVTLVRAAVAEWKRQRREVFVPLTYRPGDLAEVDFFEVLVDVAGERRKAWLFLLRLMYSGPRLRLDLRAAGSGQLSRRPRARLRAPGRRAGAHRLRQSAPGGDADPGRRRADADRRASRRWPRTTCSSRASVGPATATTRAASRRAARPFACRRSCRFRAGRRSTGSTRRCWRSSMRARDTRRDATGETIGARFAEEQRALRPVDVAFVAEAATVAPITPRGLARVAGRVLLGAVSLGGPGSDRVGRRDDGHAGRAGTDAGSRIRGNASASGRSTTGTICRSSRRSRKRCGRCCRSCSAIWGRRFPRCGRACAARTGRARRRASSPRSWASSRPVAPPWSSPRSRRRWRRARRCCWRWRPATRPVGPHRGRHAGGAARPRDRERRGGRLRHVAAGGAA